MTKLSIDEVTRIATLARIALSSEELEDLSLKLSAILQFVEHLNEVDVDGVEPTSQITGLTNVLREDEVVVSSATPQELLAGAPEVENGYVKVKRVLT